MRSMSDLLKMSKSNMLIIFDCDGVLVDSEVLASEVFSISLSKIDISLSAEACFDTFRGLTLEACFEWIENNFNGVLPDSFSQLLDDDTETAFSRQLCSVDGVDKVLDYLTKTEVNFCVASNGSHDKVVNSLTATGLISYFTHRFSVDDVARGKPSPELFLHAAKMMGALPSDVLVVEDSEAGWNAAVAASMKVFLYAPHGEPEFTKDNIVTSMDDLLVVLNAEVTGRI